MMLCVLLDAHTVLTESQVDLQVIINVNFGSKLRIFLNKTKNSPANSCRRTLFIICSKCVKLPCHYFSFPYTWRTMSRLFICLILCSSDLTNFSLFSFIHILSLTLSFSLCGTVWESEGVFISACSRLSLRLRLEDAWVLSSEIWFTVLDQGFVSLVGAAPPFL